MSEPSASGTHFVTGGEHRIGQCAGAGGATLRYREIAPAKPRGIILYLHGVESHSEWYLGSAALFADMGLATLLLDRRGSGLNAERRGDAPSLDALLEDVSRAHDHALALHGNLPVHLCAVSWGGKLALAHALQAPRALRSLALIAPGLFPRVHLTLGQAAFVALSALVRPGATTPVPIRDPALFTRRPRGLAFIRSNDRNLRRVTARFCVISRRLDLLLNNRLRELATPTSLVLAGRDEIIDTDRTRSAFQQLALAEKKIVEHPRAFHTMEFEPDARSIFSDVARWFLDHSDQPTAP